MCMWSSKTLIMHLFLLYYAQFIVNNNSELAAKREAESLISLRGGTLDVKTARQSSDFIK